MLKEGITVEEFTPNFQDRTSDLAQNTEVKFYSRAVVKIPAINASTETSLFDEPIGRSKRQQSNAGLEKENDRRKDTRGVPEMMFLVKKAFKRRPKLGNSPPERRYAWMHSRNVNIDQSDFGIVM